MCFLVWEMIILNSKKIGVIVEVDGIYAKVGMYNETNDAEFIWNGEILTGPKVGAYLTINQGMVKIIATVFSEKIIDHQNSTNSNEFDNTFSKNTINRIISLKIKGVINNNKFSVSSEYVPMIGNIVSLTTKKELDIIYGLSDNSDTILIGKSILEEYPIYLPINTIIASHIGIFGNTGSGKSNTLHKLYLELFKSKYLKKINEVSQFYVIDFNGEYTQKNQFGLSSQYKQVFKINTRMESKTNKIPIKKDYLFDADILSILFDARPATQVPFLRNALKIFNNDIKNETDFAKFEIGLLKRIIQEHKNVSADSLYNWIYAAKELGIDETLLNSLELHFSIDYGNLIVKAENNQNILEGERISDIGLQILKIEEIQDQLACKYKNLSHIRKLKSFLEFQRVFVSAWKSTNIEHINPLFKRIETSILSLEKAIEVVNDVEDKFKMLNVVSLLDANQEITRLIPMLISKMIYDEQKNLVSNEGEVKKTKHLIIDEAHNILNSQFRRNGDDWQDYRLSIFEEIIKEGRKFGFYLTLSSQRPADISPTIMSQLHNYFIHRLVNDNDLEMLKNTMPTLDNYSFNMIPNLGQGEAVITGNSINIPLLIKVNKETIIRPNSDDVNLTSLWKI